MRNRSGSSSRGMSGPWRLPLRQVAASLLLFAMMLTGIFGEIVKASHTSVVVIGGVPVVVCGEGLGDDPASPVPGTPGTSGCCEHCVLGAPAALPDAPAFALPASSRYRMMPVAVAVRLPSLSRLRSPRQSQGPPVGLR